MKIDIMREPNWLNETISLLSLGFHEDAGYPMGFISDPASYNASLDEIAVKLGTTVTYLKAVYTETRSIVKEYMDIEGYFNSKKYGSTVLMSSGIDRAERLDAAAYKKAVYQHVLLETIEMGADEDSLDFDAEASVANVFLAVTKTNWSDTEKLKVMEMFQRIDSDFNRVKELMTKVETVLRNHYKVVKGKLDETVDWYSRDDFSKVGDSVLKYINNFDNFSVSKVFMNISIVNLNYMSLIVPFTERDSAYISLGIDFDRLNELKDIGEKKEEQLLRWMKALADSNKIKILGLIAQRPMYLKELAEALGITPPTASHHVNQLAEERLIKFDIDGRRVYYRVNAEELEKAAASLIEIAERSRLSYEKEQHRDHA